MIEFEKTEIPFLNLYRSNTGYTPTSRGTYWGYLFETDESPLTSPGFRDAQAQSG
jgi:hypothetical protein